MKKTNKSKLRNKKILFISKGASASSTRYRALQYFPYFIKFGWQPSHITISGGFFSVIKTFLAAKNTDVVVLLRKTFPYPIFWVLRRLSKKLIFDFDDAIFSNTDGTSSPTRLNRFKQTIEKCDLVFAGNQYLADAAKKLQPNTLIIPTSLDVNKYQSALNQNTRNDKFTLVWIGSTSTKKYILNILPFLEASSRKIPNLQLKIISDFSITSDQIIIQNISWSEHREAMELLSSNVGLAPLPEDAWTKGKCGLKVLQYMASSLPVISSPTSVNGYLIEDGKSGYIACENDDWEKCILTAYLNRSNLKKMGTYGKQRVSNEFDINIIFNKIKNAIDML